MLTSNTAGVKVGVQFKSISMAVMYVTHLNAPDVAMVCLSQNLSHYKESNDMFVRQTCRTLSVVFSLVYDIQTCVTRLTFRGNRETLNNTQNRILSTDV